MANDDPFVLAGREYRSRLIVGTGKYRVVRGDARAPSTRRAPRSSPSRCGG